MSDVLYQLLFISSPGGTLANARVSHCGATAQWAFGWAPRFGLYAWDPHDPDQARTGLIPRSVCMNPIKSKQMQTGPSMKIHKDCKVAR